MIWPIKYLITVATIGIALPASLQAQAPFDAPKIAESELRTIAGRQDTTQVSTATQVAGVSKNSVGDNSTTGQVQISDNAFQNLSGLAVLNVNTGNNVAINAAMNVNIAIVPRP